MTRKQSRAAHHDDFEVITGIGPALARQFREAGIQTYSELASLSPAQLAKKVTGLSVKQITRQDWIGQARKLSPNQTHSKSTQKVTSKQLIRQHYENFTIEFLLDEKKIVHRTRVVHVQSGDADTWAGWEADQLIDFLARHSEAHIPEKKLRHQETSTVPTQSLRSPEEKSEPTGVKRPDTVSLVSEICEAVQPHREIDRPILHSPVNTDVSGVLCLRDLSVLLVGSTNSVNSLRQDQRFHVQLTLDLTNVVARHHVPLRCKTKVNFKQLGGASFLAAEESHSIKLADCVTLDIPCTNPPPGLYRPEALVNLLSDETAHGLMASLKGELIQFF